MITVLLAPLLLAQYVPPDFLVALQSWWFLIAAGVAALFWIRKEIKDWKNELIDEIKVKTQQIQPGANGGGSLEDANTRIASVDQKVDELVKQVRTHMSDPQAHSR